MMPGVVMKAGSLIGVSCEMYSGELNSITPAKVAIRPSRAPRTKFLPAAATSEGFVSTRPACDGYG
jgi:hypothetical protein